MSHMTLLSQKLGPSHKHPSTDRLDASLGVFRSKMVDFIAQRFLNEKGALLSLMGFHKCLELIHFTDRALAKLVAEMEYPMTRWGTKPTEEYLCYSLNLLHILNSITSSLSHLTHARALSILHKNLEKIVVIPGSGKDFKLEEPIRIRISMDDHNTNIDTEKECVVLQALRMSKNVQFLALGFVLSGLCSDPKPYLEMRKLFGGGFKDLVMEGLDLRLYKEVTKIQVGIVAMEDVRDINRGIEGLSGGIPSSSVEEMKDRLRVMENSIKGVDKAANDVFYDVLARRNKLLDNIRFTG